MFGISLPIALYVGILTAAAAGAFAIYVNGRDSGYTAATLECKDVLQSQRDAEEKKVSLLQRTTDEAVRDANSRVQEFRARLDQLRLARTTYHPSAPSKPALDAPPVQQELADTKVSPLLAQELQALQRAAEASISGEVTP